jgi:hypothetical protein
MLCVLTLLAGLFAVVFLERVSTAIWDYASCWVSPEQLHRPLFTFFPGFVC